MGDDDWGPSQTDPTWMHFFESPQTDVADDSSSEAQRTPADDVEVGPTELWADIILPPDVPALTVFRLKDLLLQHAVPTTDRRTDSRSLLRTILSRRMDIALSVPERFLSTAQALVDEELRAQGL